MQARAAPAAAAAAAVAGAPVGWPRAEHLAARQDQRPPRLPRRHPRPGNVPPPAGLLRLRAQCGSDFVFERCSTECAREKCWVVGIFFFFLGWGGIVLRGVRRNARVRNDGVVCLFPFGDRCIAGEEAGVAGRAHEAGGGDHLRDHGGPQRQPREHLRVLRLQGRDAEGNAIFFLDRTARLFAPTVG